MDITPEVVAAIAAAINGGAAAPATAPADPVIIGHLEVAKSGDQHWIVGYSADLGANVRLNQAAVDALAGADFAVLDKEDRKVSDKLTTRRIRGAAIRARVGAPRVRDGRKEATMLEFVELVKTGTTVPSKFAF